MRIEQIKDAYSARPFKPFLLRTGDGRQFRVDHPELIAFPPDGRSVVITRPSGWFDVLDAMLIASIHVGNGHGRRRGGNGRASR